MLSVTLLCALAAPLLAPPGEDLAFPHTETFSPTSAAHWTPMAGRWEFTPAGLRQLDPQFDAGAGLRVRPTGAYTVAVRFRPDSEFNGAGLFFALPQVEKKHGGMLVRCDPGGRILWGWFDAAGTFNYYNEAYYDDDGDAEQELAIAVDPAKNAFNILHHGARIATNVRTFHTAGYVGLQSSGGPHTFLEFTVRPATPDELTGLKEPGPYSRIVDIIGDERQVIALRHGDELLTAYDAEGKAIRSARSDLLPGLRPTGDVRPVALVWGRPGPQRELLVLLDGGQTIHAFDAELQPRGMDGPLYANREMQGGGLAVDADGRIFIADASIPGIRVLAADGRELAKFGEKGGLAGHDRSNPKSAGKFNTPRGIAIAPTGELVVTDRENYAYVVYRFDPASNRFTFVRNGPWLPYPAQVTFDKAGKMLLAGLFEYYRGYGALRVMSLDGIGEKTFLAHSMGNLSDKVRVCQGPGDLYYLVDPDQDRFMLLPPDFVEALPQFAWQPDGGVALTLPALDRQPLKSRAPASRGGERIQVRPSAPVCKTWPPVTPDELVSYELPPAPPAGKMYVIDMPVLVAVFTQALNEKGEVVKIDPTGVIDRLKWELEPARHFYWLNSHGLLNVQFDYLLVEDPGAKVDGGWIRPTPARTLVNQARVAQGLPPIDGDHSLLGIHPMPGFDPRATDDPGFVGGGGLTPYAYSGYALWNNGQGWLFAHEWGHQLDAYFEKSGFPDWWLNHPDATVHLGRYGEHWDCNAFLCRRADRMNWLRFKFGTLRLVTDTDGDGLVDDDPTVPLDERRFKSSPAKVDTDGDGLTDLAELTAGTFTSSDPNVADTDGDGTPDAQDAFPQYAVRTAVGAGSATDERISPLGTAKNGWGDADLGLTYDADTLYFRVVLRRPARTIYLPIDWNNDGWFTGHDNRYYSVDLDLAGDEPKVKAAHDCAATVARDGDLVIVRVQVPRLPERALLRAGGSVGVCPRLHNGGGTGAFLVDPWQLIGVELR